MAKRTLVELIDDLDGTRAERTRVFGVDGKSCVIDLSATNAAALDKALEPYLAAARSQRAGGARSRSGSSRRPDLSAIRAWATENGYAIAGRGRLPSEVIAAHEAAP